MLVNTTSLGMHGQPALEIDVGLLPPHAVVADLVYVPLETPLLAAARARGLKTADGLGMLLHQAVRGFELWFGQRPAGHPGASRAGRGRSHKALSRNIVAAPVSGMVRSVPSRRSVHARSSFNASRPLVAIAMVAASSLYAIAQQPPAPSRVRGTIEGVDGDVLAVKSRGGEDFKLHMTARHAGGRDHQDLAGRYQGRFLHRHHHGARPDGSQNAVEVHVFPEDMRGTGEGRGRSICARTSTMTNATVAETVVGNDGHTLKVKYKDGEKKVVVSPDTPVVTYVPADKSELKAGAKVIAFIKKLPDGSFEANRVSVGLDGLTPPM